MTKIAERYKRLLARRAPLLDRDTARFAEAFEGESSESVRYLLGAMRAVNRQYTERLEAQGDRVENQIRGCSKDHYPDLEFERQGSVSNGTHIKFYSDIDVLVLIDKYTTLEPPQKALYPYSGVPEDDLIALRRHCLNGLRTAFPKVKFDDSGAKAIKMSEGSLVCPVDVVTANWYDTVSYTQSGAKHDRAIQVLDRDARKRIMNRPFLINHRLDLLDRERGGMPRMLIRLLKTVKADLEDEQKRNLSISSFDLCSVVYWMPRQYFISDVRRVLEAIQSLLLWMQEILKQASIRDGLLAIDGSRIIFDDGSKRESFHQVFNELCSVYAVALNEYGSARTLVTEAHYR